MELGSQHNTTLGELDQPAIISYNRVYALSAGIIVQRSLTEYCSCDKADYQAANG